ncbi:hypothetical protein FXO38_28226 [Capsicum annuum]|uniref:Uncharacterized protein n=1 Tax=Capsicum annuum TaxID=4072 RepID=A0A2G3A6M9_CAPAN|nr:hypothetical protein FXO38_28226 [Capsicum annuum]KAF3634362.1 hypothetical protein FXO37_26528 [Capsicum annuum]PHT89843.1 hypothetical protein T459_04956 [Capsicum annuum]
MERGIADNASIAAKAQLEVARARLEVVVSKLQSTVENLAVELITSKEFLEAAHAAYLEVKDHRVGASMEREQDTINWKKELKEAEEDLERLNQKILSAKDHKAKLDTASSLLQVINNDLVAYME